MIHEHVDSIITNDVFVDLPGFLPGKRVIVKLEGLNPAGSIKLKTARALITDLEKKGLLKPKGRVVESSSGNLGIGLASVCAARGYHLTVVTDPNATKGALAMIRSLGADVVVVAEPDSNGGYLMSRIATIERMLAKDPQLQWTNQYANSAGADPHYELTARSIHGNVPFADAVAIGAGTTGTLMGCARYFSTHCPQMRVIAIDSVGSVLFGGPGRKRYIPGIGVSRVPEIYKEDSRIEKLLVAERDGALMCRELACRYGLMLGGSSGSVLAGVRALNATIPDGSTVVAVSPDMGDRYLDTVYCNTWVKGTLSDETSAPVS